MSKICNSRNIPDLYFISQFFNYLVSVEWQLAVEIMISVKNTNTMLIMSECLTRIYPKES